MLSYLLNRLLVTAAVAFTVSVATFFLLHLSGDLAAAIAGPEATGEQVEAIRHQFGLDQPLLAQYGAWLWHALHLDFGRSYFFQDQVIDLVRARIPVTLTLGGLSLLFSLILAIPLGVIAAVYRDTWVDRLALVFAVLGQAMPSFWFGLTLILIFSVHLRWLPSGGNEGWTSYILPVVALGYNATPAIMRLTRNGMLEVLGADYIRTARAKGLRPSVVLFKHALRNAVIPVVSLTAVQLGFMLGGSLVIEAVFSLQGLGYLAWEAIQRNDYPVMQAIVLILALIFVLLTLIADLLSALIDPRLRVQ